MMQMKIPADPGLRPGVLGIQLLNRFILASLPVLLISFFSPGPGLAGVPGPTESWPAWALVWFRWPGLEQGTPAVLSSVLPAASFFALRLLVAVVVSLAWAVLFSRGRRRELDPGWLYHAWLFVLLVPATVPIPLLVIGLSFGMLFGCHVFGGTGRCLVNPALLAAVFLLVAYPEFTRIGWMPGPRLPVMTAAACFAGALALVVAGLASWRVIAGGLAGMLAAALVFDPIPWLWQPLLGLFAFALAFVATDPGSLPMTRIGCWMFGILFGAGTVMIRMLNPEHPEGTLFALLLASLLTPVIDHWALGGNSIAAADTHEPA